MFDKIETVPRLFKQVSTKLDKVRCLARTLEKPRGFMSDAYRGRFIKLGELKGVDYDPAVRC